MPTTPFCSEPERCWSWATRITRETRRSYTTRTLLLDGRVLIAGGSDNTEPTADRASAELYNPATGRFTATGSMTQGRYGNAATTLSDGRVLITGGRDPSNNEMATAELFDPATG